MSVTLICDAEYVQDSPWVASEWALPSVPGTVTDVPGSFGDT